MSYETVKEAVQKLLTKNPKIIQANVKDYLPLTKIKEELAKLESIQLTKQKNKTDKGFFMSYGKDYDQQADLVDYQSFAKANKGYNYILTIIDVYSRYAWAVPLKTKTGATVAEAFLKHPLPLTLQTDQGAEFMSKPFQQMLEQRNIPHRAVDVGDKKAMSIVERFNRTLTEKIKLLFTFTQKTVWVDYLDEILAAYNRQPHKTIQNTPYRVYQEGKEPIYNIKTKIKQDATLAVGALVRVKIKKRLFEKRTNNYSAEVYKVVRMGPKILLSDGKEYKRSQLLEVPPATSSTAPNTIYADMRKQTQERKTNLKLKAEDINEKNIVEGKRKVKRSTRLLPVN